MGFFNKFVLLVSVFVLVAPIVFSEDVKITGFVNDYAGVINSSDKLMIESVLSEIYTSGVAQFSVVTVKSLEGKAIESYSLELAQGNLGDSEKNNGLLLLISVEDRKYRFEVGRGLEATLNDAKVGRIGRDYLVPNFREGNYGKGILGSSFAVKSVLLGETNSSYYVKNDATIGYPWNFWIFFVMFILFFVLIPVLSHSSKLQKGKNKYFDAAAGAIILFGGGRGGSGGSGGFGGFGGGGFGGGGASGGW